MEGAARLLHTAELHEYRRYNHEDRLIFALLLFPRLGSPAVDGGIQE
jgi:hypothetical protein